MAGNSYSGRDWLRLVFAVAWLIIFVTWPQPTFAITLVIIGGALIAFNLRVFWLTVVCHEPASSVAPIVGGAIAAVGIAILPVAGSWKWAWIPFVIDWGGLPIFLAAWYEGRGK